ncbi:hypothetical protein HYT32_00360 [Candidatus Roizmanbacteria bacterium]|nr:hypothetical protein [Candidatus Roizmanbacteria bacterium]
MGERMSESEYRELQEEAIKKMGGLPLPEITPQQAANMVNEMKNSKMRREAVQQKIAELAENNQNLGKWAFLTPGMPEIVVADSFEESMEYLKDNKLPMNTAIIRPIIKPRPTPEWLSKLGEGLKPE